MRIILASIFLLYSCGPNNRSNGSSNTHENGVIDASTGSNGKKQSLLVANSEELPKCEGQMLGSLAYVRSESLFYACEKTGWTSISIKGDPGPKGDPGAPGQKADSSSSTSNAVVWKTVKANGVVIGKTMESLSGVYDWVTVGTAKGYSFTLTTGGEVLKSSLPTYYSSVDCSGDMYVMANWNVRGTTFWRGENLYYIARHAQLQKGITIRSITSATSSCSSGDFTESFKEYFFTKDVFPNDPEVTGVSSTTFSLPITVE